MICPSLFLTGGQLNLLIFMRMSLYKWLPLLYPRVNIISNIGQLLTDNTKIKSMTQKFTVSCCRFSFPCCDRNSTFLNCCNQLCVNVG